MKELSIEQKAERFDEAIERAKGVIEQNPLMEYLKKGIEYIFPELKESKDERIRQLLIGVVELYYGNTDEQEKKDCLTWLEKQGEHLENYDEAEKEKADFVGDGFIECHADFLDFKEGNTYWLEYIGDDKYNVRSDNLLGKTYHITPCQLYTIFKKLTWLEKQGELKPQGKTALEAIKEEKVDNQNCVKSADEVEPKFHAGEWIVENTDTSTWLITKVFTTEENVTAYNMINQEGRTLTIGSHNIDYHHHLWTIKDAKAGDVLADKYNNIGFLKECEGIYWDSYIYLGCDGKLRGFSIGGKHEQTDAHPATKEQRDAIMKAMADAGYTFDFEKKELKKIESYSLRSIIKDKPSPAIKKVVDSLTAWSEEDEEIARALNDYVKNLDTLFSKINIGGKDVLSKEFREKVQHWLKSIKDRVQPKQEWSKEDDRIYYSLLADIRTRQDGSTSTLEAYYNEQIEWIKSLKDRVQTKPKQEWSEEDERYLSYSIHAVEDMLGNNGKNTVTWLKYLKDRYTWKPSDEQITWLYRAADDASKDSRMKQILNELLSDLKKLKE